MKEKVNTDGMSVSAGNENMNMPKYDGSVKKHKMACRTSKRQHPFDKKGKTLGTIVAESSSRKDLLENGWPSLSESILDTGIWNIDGRDIEKPHSEMEHLWLEIRGRNKCSKALVGVVYNSELIINPSTPLDNLESLLGHHTATCDGMLILTSSDPHTILGKGTRPSLPFSV